MSAKTGKTLSIPRELSPFGWLHRWLFLVASGRELNASSWTREELCGRPAGLAVMRAQGHEITHSFSRFHDNPRGREALAGNEE
jgi:hypothetical protein